MKDLRFCAGLLTVAMAFYSLAGCEKNDQQREPAKPPIAEKPSETGDLGKEIEEIGEWDSIKKTRVNAFNEFVEENGKFSSHLSVRWDKTTPTPSGIYCAIDLSKYQDDKITRENVVTFTKSFADKYKTLLGIDDINNLKLMKIAEIKNRDDVFGVFYQQTYKGVPVIKSRVRFYIDDNKLYSFGSRYYPNISLSVDPVIKKEKAKEIANEATYNESKRILTGFDISLKIYPLNPKELDYKLIWDVRINDMMVYVDAISGKVLTKGSVLTGPYK